MIILLFPAQCICCLDVEDQVTSDKEEYRPMKVEETGRARAVKNHVPEVFVMTYHITC